MNKEVKAKWIEALNSGEFVQGRKWMKRNVDGQEQFCCLGVLCELYRGENTPEKEMEDLFPMQNERVRLNTATLPCKVASWAGLPIPKEYFDSAGYRYGTLADLNDKGYTFAEIAQVIEEKL